MKFETTKITKIQHLGEGTRVIIDFIDVLNPNEGVMVGNTAQGCFVVMSESRHTSNYPPRTFRVNCGALHQYIYLEDQKTKYLSEVAPGDKVLVVSQNGDRLVSIGRVKIEKRELVRLETERNISTTLQLADSVYVKGEEDNQIEVMSIDEGCLISVFLADSIARHKGDAIEEEISEL